MKCAKCHGDLKRVTVQDLELDRCDRCGGLWFDKAELTKVLSLSWEEAPELHVAPSDAEPHTADDTKAGTCPRCNVALEREDSLAVDSIGYDQCKLCLGVWLDGGEIDTMLKDPTARATGQFFKGAF